MALDQSALWWNTSPPLTTPAEDLLADDPALAKLLSTAIGAETAARDAEAVVEEARSAVEHAQAQDARIARDALAAGKADPGRRGAEKAEKGVLDAEHVARTLFEVATSARASFATALAKDANQRRERWDAEFDQCAQDALAALGKATEALDRRARMKALVTWQAQRGTRFAPQKIEVTQEIDACSTRLAAVDVAARNARENEVLDREREVQERARGRARLEEINENHRRAERSQTWPRVQSNA